MKTITFCSLEFFAKHFNVPEKDLQWGFIKNILQTEEEPRIGILVKNTNLAIDVLKGEFVSEIPNEVVFIKARAVLIGSVLLMRALSAEELEGEISEKTLSVVYRNRWYTQELNGQIIL